MIMILRIQEGYIGAAPEALPPVQDSSGHVEWGNTSR